MYNTNRLKLKFFIMRYGPIASSFVKFHTNNKIYVSKWWATRVFMLEELRRDRSRIPLGS